MHPWMSAFLTIALFAMLYCKIYAEVNLQGVDYKEELLYKLTGQRTNLTHLLEQYSAICPLQKQCNLFSANIKHLERPEVIRALPQCNCSCSYDCVLNRNCCPGNIYGYLRQTCINVGIFNNETGNQYLMVSDCPPSNVTDNDAAVKCVSEKQTTTPVTSYRTNITYRNIHCALCNGESSVRYWDIHIKCGIKPPNLFKTLLDVISLKAMYNCSASYWLNADKKMLVRPVECTTPSKSMFESCNQTGLWPTVDETVDWACKTLYSRFYNFKNVFCYICNPSVASRYENTLADTCGSIGGRSEVAMGVNHLCESRPSIDRLAPYKNVFCMLCIGHSFSQNSLGSNFVTENLTGSGSSTVQLTAIVRKTDIWELMHILNDVHGNIEMSMKTYRSSESNRHLPNQKTQVKLIKYFIQACGDNGLCGHPKGKPKTNPAGIPICGTCSCNGNCLENKTCCPDLIVKNQPYTCIDVKDFVAFPPNLVDGNSLPSASVVDRCINRAKTKNLHLCEVDTDEKFKLTSFVPISINHSNMVYKNIYCYLCNHGNKEENDTLSVNITLYCNTLIEPYRFLDLKTLLNASSAFCNTSFVPYNAQPCKSHREINSTDVLSYTDWRSDILTYTRNLSAISSYSHMNMTRFARCNETMNSQHDGGIIRSVCEGTSESILALPVYKYNYNVYKNFACFVCNRAHPNSTFNTQTVQTISGCRSNASRDSVLQCEKRDRDPLWLPYKNYFCADCNLGPLKEKANPNSRPTFTTTIKTVQPTTIPLPTTATPDSRPPPTFRFLFSIHHEEWVRVESHCWSTLPSCDNGTYDQTLGSCRQLYCDEGRTLENSTCHVISEVAANIVYAIKINLSPMEAFHTSNETDGLHVLHICKDVFRMCMGSISNILDTFHKFVSCSITTNSQCETKDTIGITTTSFLHIVLNVEIIATRNLTMVETELIHCLDMMYDVRVDENVNITFNSSFLTDFEERRSDIQGSICKVNVSGNGSKDKTESPFQITHLMLCPQVELSEDEYKFNNETGTVFIYQNSLNKTEKEFRWHNSSIRICQYNQSSPEYRKRSKNTLALMKQYALFSQIAIALSLACLFLTFVTYCIFPVLRTLPGRNIMVLTYNLFLAQALLTFVSYIGDSHILCTASGICLHYCWMSTFCAMNVCSYHMFKIFCLRLFESHSRVIHRRDFMRYLVYVHGAPVVVIVFTVTVHLSMSLGSFTGYGSRHGCFLSNNYSVIFAFLLPATASFLMNIACFLAVARKIRSSPGVARSTDKNDFLICVKICVIVGVAWPLQTLDGMLDFSVLSFVATALNGLQGVYIFISFVCNRRVICYYRSLIGRIRSPTLQTSTSVTSSSEPLPSPMSLTTSTSLSQLTSESFSKM